MPSCKHRYRLHGRYVSRQDYYEAIRREEADRRIPSSPIPNVYSICDPETKETVCVSVAEHEAQMAKVPIEEEDPKREPFFGIMESLAEGVAVLQTERVNEILAYRPPEWN